MSGIGLALVWLSVLLIQPIRYCKSDAATFAAAFASGLTLGAGIALMLAAELLGGVA